MTYTTEQLEEMLADATPGEWLYRPDHLDDWGTVKSGPFVICRARDPRMMADEVLMAHRENGSDPWEHNARLISLTPTITAELIAARRKLEWVQGLVEAATALLAQVDGLIPIKHPQQKLERNKLRHAITAIAALDAAQ